MRKEEKIKCAECSYCESYREERRTRSGFVCEHPDQKYILEYFKQNRISKMPGFLGYGAKWSEEVPVKTSPKWCPRKRLN